MLQRLNRLRIDTTRIKLLDTTPWLHPNGLFRGVRHWSWRKQGDAWVADRDIDLHGPREWSQCCEECFVDQTIAIPPLLLGVRLW